METRKYSWIVHVPSTDRMIQVNADRAAVDAVGALSFFAEGTFGDPEYLLFCLPPGKWGHCSIMSQVTGHQNGFEVLGDGP